MSNDSSGTFINFVLSMLLRKIVTPSGYHDRVKAVKEMQEDDVSGLVDSLTDFLVNTANIDFTIETDNDEFTRILKKWLDTINIAYNGQLPSGIKPLAKEYFKERWKYSSFPILKIADWTPIDGGIIVPSKMFILDGASIHAKDKNEDDEDLKIINYDYFLGTKGNHKLNKNVIITKPYSRWHDKYPNPFLIKRGIYHNWKIIQSLKKKQTEILDQIIPYMLLIKKGTEGLAKESIKTYSQEELKAVTQQFQDLMDNMKGTALGEKSIKSPTRATNFDEEIKHLIPDLSTIFKGELFAVAERNILSGLGFIDVVEATSTSRRESILNPKAFIEEAKSGVEGFKQIIKELIVQIIQKNEKHIKYVNSEFHITSSPITGFMTDTFKQEIRLLWKHGQLSNETYVELVGETEYRTEIHRRKKEAKQGIDVIMRPHMTDNKEEVSIDIPGEKPIDKDIDKNGKPIQQDKISSPEKYNIGASFKCECIKCGHKMTSVVHCKDYKCPKCGGQMRRTKRPGTGQPSESELVTAPYTTLQSLPPSIRKLSKKKQRTFMKVWNRAYYYKLGKTNNKKKAETYAFKVAYNTIKNVAKTER